MTMPTVFIQHGGGPMPLLGRQPAVSNFLGAYMATLPSRPSAVVVVTAHWEDDPVAVCSADAPPLYFDYGGFPPETYEYKYPADGAPALAEQIRSLLKASGVQSQADAQRGWDHGVFVPMKLLVPDADIPVVALSLRAGQRADDQVAIGKALAPLRDQGVLIIGSGASFHNFKYFFARDAEVRSRGQSHAQAFDQWLRSSVTDTDLSPDERIRRLCAWETAPSAREAHPPRGAEHLMPLFVCLGAALGAAGRRVGEEDGTSLANSQFEWSGEEPAIGPHC